MKPLITVGLLAGAVALLFKDQIADAFAGHTTMPAAGTTTPPATTTTPPATTTTPPANTTTPPTNTTTPPTNTTPPPAAKTIDGFAAYVATVAGRAPQMTADAWNYYYSAYFGVPQTADLFTPGARDEQIDFRTYVQRRSAAGLSGARPSRQFLSSTAWGRA